MRTAILIALGLYAAAVAQADTITLQSGEVVIGKVITADESGAEVAVHSKDGQNLRLKRQDIEPTSLYAVLESRTASADPAARLRLAKTAEDLGLWTHALAEYDIVVALDPARLPAVKLRRAAVREKVATAIQNDAAEALEAGDLATAKLNADVVVSTYAGTNAHGRARTLVRTIARKMAAMDRKTKVARERAQKAVAGSAKHEKRADALGLSTRGAIGTRSAERRKHKSAIRALELAHKAIAGLELESAEDELAEVLATAQERVRTKLKLHYIALGMSYLQTRSLPTAEEYNAKACRLEPEGSECRDLQQLIVQGRLSSGWSRR